MWIIFWIVLGAYAWLSGFFHVGLLKEDGTSRNEAFVRPPYIIFLLCGAPTLLNIPKGVVLFRALVVQLEGILLISYGGLYRFLPNHNLTVHAFILFFAFTFVLWFSWALYKHYPYTIDDS